MLGPNIVIFCVQAYAYFNEKVYSNSIVDQTEITNLDLYNPQYTQYSL